MFVDQHRDLCKPTYIDVFSWAAQNVETRQKIRKQDILHVISRLYAYFRSGKVSRSQSNKSEELIIPKLYFACA